MTSSAAAKARRQSARPESIADRSALLLGWYDRHRRRLPWRPPAGERADPYRVWLSEIMLQQTGVKTVGPYFEKFLARWPDVAALGRASQDDVKTAYKSPDEAVEQMSGEGSAAVIGTPDDLVQMIKQVLAQSGGFGTCVGFVHDWANPENTFRSWDMVARYVIPEINGYVTKLRESEKYLQDNRAVFDNYRLAARIVKIN